MMLLSNRYDIKGCEVGRWTNPDTGGKQIIKVLKDNNFQGQSIALGRRSALIETRLLSLLGVNLSHVQTPLWSLQVGRNLGLPVRRSWTATSCGSSMCWTTASCWPINLCTRTSWKENTLWQTSSSEQPSRPPSSFFKFQALPVC